MPFASPPKVQIGTDPEWHQTEWDETLTAAEVEAGDQPKLSVLDVAYLHWTVRLDDEPAKVCKLLVAGDAAVDPSVNVVVTLSAGRHLTQLQTRADGSPEVRHPPTSAVIVNP